MNQNRVQFQKTADANNALAYRDWLELRGAKDAEGSPREPATANPDVLPASVGFYHRTTRVRVIQEAIRGMIAKAPYVLTEKQLEAFTLVMLTDMPVAQAARVMRLSRSGVRTHLEAAKKKLRKVYNETYE
jgi:DNA-directed RNA polymerase specialized sigma24 family protein